MRKFTSAALFAAAIIVGACSPQTFTMNVEMRSPSESGVDLSGKSASVVYVDDGKDSEFCRGFSDAFAKTLEEDYFGGQQAIGVYKVDYREGADYSCADTLKNLSVDTDGDVVFLVHPHFSQMTLSEVYPSALSSADSAYIVYAKMPFTLNMYVYDAPAGGGKVQEFKGTSIVKQPVFSPEVVDEKKLNEKVWPMLAPQGETTGERAAQKFLSTWKNEQYTMFYFDSPQAWNTGGQAAYEYKWAKAIKAWMTLLDTNDLQKRSCAEYNIAVACYMLGDYDLATKWLDQSDTDAKTVLSDGLRKRINLRKVK